MKHILIIFIFLAVTGCCQTGGLRAEAEQSLTEMSYATKAEQSKKIMGL